MFQKLKTVVWFLQRPHLYPQMLRLVHTKFMPWQARQEKTAQESIAWCEPRALDSRSAFEKLTGQKAPESVLNQFPNQFHDAQERALACPVKMGGPGDLDLIHWLAEAIQATRVIETGVAYGWSSLSLLLSLQKRSGARLVSTDMPYVSLNNEEYVGIVVPEELRQHWKIIRRADRQALPMALGELPTIDLCHYDSDKSYSGRLWAYPLLWKALKPGGFFVSDDICDNVGFRDFAATLGLEPVVVKTHGKFIGVIQKPA